MTYSCPTVQAEEDDYDQPPSDDELADSEIEAMDDEERNAYVHSLVTISLCSF